MTAIDASELLHPVAAESDLTLRHVYQGRLFGQELAIWRADDGHVNVWENRCIHRGVRLSTAMNDGAELVCQYHEWRYSNRSGSCNYIPAHPADSPARSMAVTTYPCRSAHGLVWSGCATDAEPPEIASLAEGHTVLRALPVDTSALRVLTALGEWPFEPIPSTDVTSTDVCSATSESPYSVTVSHGDGESVVVYFVQPVDRTRCVIRPVLAGAPDPGRKLEVLRHHAKELERFRADVENRPDDGVAVELPRLAPTMAPEPGRSRAEAGRVAAQQVLVARKWAAGGDIAGFELVPRSGELISFQPGAHIDIHLDNGLVRQYSLTNGPHQTDCYRIGVKLEAESRGGSRYLHDKVVEGDVLAVSEPRNNFPLRRDASTTILVAGGVGITPLLSMAQTLARQQLRFQLHYFVRDENQIAFPELLGEVAHGLKQHIGLSPDETVAALGALLAGYDPGLHLYVCGPGPMLESARAIAAESGWPDDAVHFEYFQNTGEIDDSSTFDVELARTGSTLTVPAGQSLLETLRSAGVALASSCEQGACGTCMATVLEGEVDHQDVYLRPSEHDAGDRILTCVSRAASDRLVLDL